MAARHLGELASESSPFANHHDAAADGRAKTKPADEPKALEWIKIKMQINLPAEQC